MFDAQAFINGPNVGVSMRPETIGRIYVSAEVNIGNGPETLFLWLTQERAIEIGKLLARDVDIALSRAATWLWEVQHA